MTDQRTGGRTEAHADRGLRGAVVGYHGYPQLTPGALAPSAAEEPVVSIILCWGRAALGATSHPFEVIPVPGDRADRDALLDRTSRGLQIDLTPMGASRLLGVSADQLTADELDPNAVLGADIARVLSRLASAPTWAIRFAAVDKYMLQRLKGAPPRSLSAGAAWRRFAESPGMVLVGEMALEAASDEDSPSPGMLRNGHNVAADRLRRWYRHTTTDSPTA